VHTTRLRDLYYHQYMNGHPPPPSGAPQLTLAKVDNPRTRVQLLQGYLDHKKQEPTVGLYLWAYGGPRGVVVFYERGTPVSPTLHPKPETGHRTPYTTCTRTMYSC
jgi:hypothetical protein